MNPNARILALCLFEGASFVVEQDQMAAPAAQPAQPGMPDPAAQQPAQTPAPSGGDGQPLTVDKLISRLNAIRGGRSFSDPEVYNSLANFFKNLNDSDKQVLDNILLEISKIVINAETEQTPPAQQQAPQTQSGQGAPPPQQPAAAAPAPAAAPTGAAPAV